MKGDDEEGEIWHPSLEQRVVVMAREWRGKYSPRFQGAAVHPKTAVKLTSRSSSPSLLQKEQGGERKNPLLHSLLPRAALHDQEQPSASAAEVRGCWRLRRQCYADGNDVQGGGWRASFIEVTH